MRRAESTWSRYQSPVASDWRWVCTSMKPGRSVASPRSITSAPAGSGTPGPTAAMRPPRTTTIPGETTVSPRPSNRRAAFSTSARGTIVFGGGGVAGSCAALASGDARVKSATARRRSRFTGASRERPFLPERGRGCALEVAPNRSGSADLLHELRRVGRGKLAGPLPAHVGGRLLRDEHAVAQQRRHLGQGLLRRARLAADQHLGGQEARPQRIE